MVDLTSLWLPILLSTVALYFLSFLATLGVPAGTDFMPVFRFVGTAAILTYTAASVPGTIWFNLRLPGYIIDGLMHGLATGAIFACFWPGGPVSKMRFSIVQWRVAEDCLP